MTVQIIEKVDKKRQESASTRAEWGRKAILGGCCIAMIGMVTYCFATLGSGADADMYSALFRNGIVGWAALLLLLVGVGIWLAGNIVLLSEEDRASSGKQNAMGRMPSKTVGPRSETCQPRGGATAPASATSGGPL